jgi:hypothetical protein
LCTADRIDHGANRAFAIRSSDVNDLEWRIGRHGELRAFDTNAATKFVEQTLDIFQTKLDSEALEAVEPGKRFFIR